MIARALQVDGQGLRMPLCRYAVLAVLLCRCPAMAQEETAPRFIVHTKDGPLAPAALRKFGAGWALERDGAPEVFAASSWMSMQQQGRARPAPVTAPLVLLGNGDRLPIKRGRPVSLQDGRLLFTPAEPVESRTGAELSLFRPYVAVVVLAAPQGVDDVELLLARLQHEPRDNDVVLLRNGDRIEGAVDRLSETDGCEMVADGQTVLTPLRKLAGIAFATTSQAKPRPNQLHALAVLSGGARVRFASLQLDSGKRQWSGRTTTGAEVAMAASDLIALDLLQGRTLYVTEIPPFAYRYTSYLGVTWQPGIDSSVDGRPLRAGEDYYDKGLSLHGRSRITYWLDGHFAWFESVVALDPLAGTKGRARLAMLVDGRRYPIADGKELTVEDAPVPVRLDVRGARTLTLVVELGSLGNVQARVNWAGARLLRNKD
jgi:NPCBM/NEW2 domain